MHTTKRIDGSFMVEDINPHEQIYAMSLKDSGKRPSYLLPEFKAVRLKLLHSTI